MVANELFDVRQIETIKALSKFLRKYPLHGVQRMLDLGCGDGSFTMKVAEMLSAKEVYGVDIDSESIKEARVRGVKAYEADLNADKLPFPDESFDVVTAFEVIEHLWNTDNLLQEAHRVLRKGGFFILTTPNPASWVNRLLLLFGYLPMHYNCSLRFELEKRPFQSKFDPLRPCTHIRLYTLKTLVKHLQLYGFRIVYLSGFSTAYTSRNIVVRILDKIFSLKKTLAAGVLVVASK